MSPEAYAKIKEKYPKFNEPWSDDEILELTMMANDARTREEMSAQLQRSPSSIRIKLEELGLYVPKPAGKPWLAEDDETLKTMYENGATFGQMSERFGRSESAIVSRLVRLRLSLFKQN